MTNETAPNSPWELAEMQIESLLRTELTNIRLLEDMEFSDAIDSTELAHGQSGRDHVCYTVELFETEQHARNMSPNSEYEIQSDAFRIYLEKDTGAGPRASVDPFVPADVKPSVKRQMGKQTKAWREEMGQE